jgi:hypothetical protein
MAVDEFERGEVEPSEPGVVDEPLQQIAHHQGIGEEELLAGVVMGGHRGVAVSRGEVTATIRFASLDAKHGVRRRERFRGEGRRLVRACRRSYGGRGRGRSRLPALLQGAWARTFAPAGAPT